MFLKQSSLDTGGSVLPSLISHNVAASFLADTTQRFCDWPTGGVSRENGKSTGVLAAEMDLTGVSEPPPSSSEALFPAKMARLKRFRRAREEEEEEEQPLFLILHPLFRSIFFIIIFKKKTEHKSVSNLAGN